MGQNEAGRKGFARCWKVVVQRRGSAALTPTCPVVAMIGRGRGLLPEAYSMVHGEMRTRRELVQDQDQSVKLFLIVKTCQEFAEGQAIDADYFPQTISASRCNSWKHHRPERLAGDGEPEADVRGLLRPTKPTIKSLTQSSIPPPPVDVSASLMSHRVGERDLSICP